MSVCASASGSAVLYPLGEGEGEGVKARVRVRG